MVADERLGLLVFRRKLAAKFTALTYWARRSLANRPCEAQRVPSIITDLVQFVAFNVLGGDVKMPID